MVALIFRIFKSHCKKVACYLILRRLGGNFEAHDITSSRSWAEIWKLPAEWSMLISGCQSFPLWSVSRFRYVRNKLISSLSLSYCHYYHYLFTVCTAPILERTSSGHKRAFHYYLLVSHDHWNFALKCRLLFPNCKEMGRKTRKYTQRNWQHTFCAFPQIYRFYLFYGHHL